MTMSFTASPLLVSIALLIGLTAPPAARADSELERAYRIIAGRTFVDLTHSFGPDTPVWSGFGQAKMSPAADPQTLQPNTIQKRVFPAPRTSLAGSYGSF